MPVQNKRITSDRTKFKDDNTRDNIIEIYTSSEGSSGTKISLYRSALLSALTISSGASIANAQVWSQGYQLLPVVLQQPSVCSQMMQRQILYHWEPLVYPWVCLSRQLQILLTLRAQASGGMSRLNFAADSLSSMETNMRAAIGRIEDVDIAEESANLAKFSILTQAAAAMVAQANTTNDVALDASPITRPKKIINQ